MKVPVGPAPRPLGGVRRKPVQGVSVDNLHGLASLPVCFRDWPAVLRAGAAHGLSACVPRPAIRDPRAIPR
jgi:hypothetical protein